MVSLRERKARPSYTNIPEGLENLTDSEEERTRRQASGSRRPGPSARLGTGSVSPRATGRGSPKNSVDGLDDGDEDVDSLSSGDSSAFELSDHGKKGKGKGRATGKAKGRGESVRRRGESSGSDSDSLDEELNELEVMDDTDVDEGSDVEMEEVAPKKGKVRVAGRQTLLRRPGKSRQRTHSGKEGHVYAQSDLNLVPPSYRALIRKSAENMVKPPPSKLWPHARVRAVDSGGFPGGNVVPFITRLKGDKEVVEVAGKREERQARAIKLERAVTVGIGMEGWEGEGWYREMYDPQGQGQGEREGAEDGGRKGKGKAKAAPVEDEQGTVMPEGLEGWKLRGEVRMGFDHVGRVGIKELEFVPQGRVGVYLPSSTTANGDPAVTVHVGRYDDQRPARLRMFDQVNTSQYDTLRESIIFSAGGPIWGLDWCPLPESQAKHYNNTQFLAVTTLPDIDTKPAIGEKWSRDTMSAIQIWSATFPEREVADEEAGPAGGVMKCEMVLCVRGGPGMMCKWMPLGAWDNCDPAKLHSSKIPKIGILAVIQLDGSISFYAVPHPLVVRQLLEGQSGDSGKPLLVKCHEPVLRIDVVDAVPTCMDWLTGSKLAVGYSNGSVAVWDVAEALRTDQRETLLPHVYVSIAQSCISSVAAGRVPSSTAEGKPHYDEDPRFIVVSSWDGTINMLDLRDPGHPLLLNRARLPYMVTAWSSQNQAPLSADSDYTVFLYKIKGVPVSRHASITPHRGSIWDIGTSDYHTMIASASADGSVSIGSTQLGFYRSRKAPLYFWRLLEMDYDKVTGHYRLNDDFIPETMSLDKASGRKPKKKGQLAYDDATAMKAGNWDPRVAIHRATWNEGSGLARAGMLAVGSASGLGMVQVVNPKWRSGVDTAKLGT